MESLSTDPSSTDHAPLAVLDPSALGQQATGGTSSVLPSSAVDMPRAGSSASVEALRQSRVAATHVDAGLTGVQVLESGLEVLEELNAIRELANVLEGAIEVLSAKLAVPVLTGIKNGPLIWAQAVDRGATQEIKDLVTGPIDLFLAVASFAGRATGCILFRAGLGWAEIQARDVIGPGVLLDAERDLCKPYEDFKKQLESLCTLADESLSILGDMLKHPVDATREVLELAIILFAELNDLSDQDSPLRTKVWQILENPELSGEFTGRLLVNVLLLLVPGGEEADAAAQAGRALSLTARRAEVEARLAQLGLAVGDTTLPSEFLEVVEEVRQAFRQSRLRLSESVKDRKFQIVSKVSKASKLTEALVLASRERIYAAIFEKRGAVGSIRSLGAAVGELNAHSKVIYLLELERQGVPSLKAADIAINSATVAEQLLDLAHLVDASYLERVPEPARVLLGWAGTDDMPGVIATASEHRRSWPKYFSGLDNTLGEPLPKDLSELQSVTPYFRKRIIKVDALGKPLPGELTPVAGAVFLGPEAKASDIVRAHLNVWKDPKFSMPGGLASKGAIPELERILNLLLAHGL